jgi:regulator of nucleoside diphosphate kinase
MATQASAPIARRPPVHLIDHECDALLDLALGAETRHPVVAAMLLSEIDRAEIHRPDAIPPDAVTLGSEVDFLDEGTGRLRSLKLVLPAEADIAVGRISVLTPVGAGLIGLRAGQTIDWPDRDSRNHRLRILAVRQPH